MATRSRYHPVELAWQAIDDAPLGFVELDRGRRILRANRTLCGWLGYAPDELVGRPFVELLPKRFHEPLLATCRAGNAARPRRLQVIRRDGGQLRVDVRAYPAPRSGGPVRGGCQLVVSTREAEPRPRPRASLRDTNARLCELVQRLSHLRAIEARTLSESLGERIGRELGELRGELNRLARLGAGAPRHAMRRRDVMMRLERAQEQLRQLRYELAPPGATELGLGPALARRIDAFAARTGLAVDCKVAELPESLSPRSASLLERALEEGLHNVERHAGARRVEVEAGANGAWVVLRVSDDGAGLDGADRSQPRRLGLLGLEVCLAEIGGTLQVVGKPGRGTTLVAAVPGRPRQGARKRVAASTH